MESPLAVVTSPSMANLKGDFLLFKHLDCRAQRSMPYLGIEFPRSMTPRSSPDKT